MLTVQALGSLVTGLLASFIALPPSSPPALNAPGRLNDDSLAAASPPIARPRLVMQDTALNDPTRSGPASSDPDYVVDRRTSNLASSHDAPRNEPPAQAKPRPPWPEVWHPTPTAQAVIKERLDVVDQPSSPQPTMMVKRSELPQRPDVDPANGLNKRWEGWTTVTETYYVYDVGDLPPSTITWYEPYYEPYTPGVVTVTVYVGPVVQVQPVTVTIYPATPSPGGGNYPGTPSNPTPTSNVCLPGDSTEMEYNGLRPTHDQSLTLYVIAIYIVGIGLAWNLIIVRELLFPYKFLVTGIHEVGHFLSCLCLGYRIGFFTADPRLGGLTLIKLGDDEGPLPMGALPLGYVMNIFVGGVLTFCGFNTLASKIASFIVGIAWLVIFSVSAVLAKVMTLLAAGLMVGLWWADHAWGLRFYILFIGVMCSFYVLWDTMDDAVFRKTNPCCASQFATSLPFAGPGLWVLIWFLASFILFVLFVLAALATWKQSHHAMYCQAQAFLPT